MEFNRVMVDFAIALGLGLLVGLQRERTHAELAGIRTFPLVTALGLFCGLLAQTLGGWVVAAGFVALAVGMIGGILKLKGTDTNPGITTEVALLLMFALGGVLAAGQRPVAVVAGAVVAVLLHLKPEMHALALRIGDRDFRAIMQFVVISLVILPVLPDRSFGPYEVLNPRRMWWLLVLITGLSLGGYLVYKWLGARAGVLVGGLLGGLISSTATTVSFARRSRSASGGAGSGATVILLASAIVFIRVLVLLAVLRPASARAAILPLTVLLVVMLALAGLAWRGARGDDGSLQTHSNPTELKSGIIFVALFAAILLGVAWAKDHFGQSGLFTVAAISGLTDMDAITLSAAQMANAGRITDDTTWRVVVTAAMSNLVFKGGTVIVLGTTALRKQVLVAFAVVLAAGAALLAFG